MNQSLSPLKERGNQGFSLIENQEAFKDLELMLIRDGTTDLIVQVFIGHRLCSLQALIRQCWPV